MGLAAAGRGELVAHARRHRVGDRAAGAPVADQDHARVVLQPRRARRGGGQHEVAPLVEVVGELLEEADHPFRVLGVEVAPALLDALAREPLARQRAGGRVDRRDEILGVLLELLLVVGLQEGERGVGGDERLAALGVDGVAERRLGGERLL